MSDAIRLERVTQRTYRIRTSRFAKPDASSIDERREAPTSGRRATWRASRFATGQQRRSGGDAAK